MILVKLDLVQDTRQLVVAHYIPVICWMQFPKEHRVIPHEIVPVEEQFSPFRALLNFRNLERRPEGGFFVGTLHNIENPVPS